MRSKIDWASLIVGKKFTVFALFYVVIEGNFQVQAPGGAYVWRGDLTEGFWRYEFGGLIFGEVIHGGAYFRNFTVLYWCCSAEKFPHPCIMIKWFTVKCPERYLTRSYVARNFREFKIRRLRTTNYGWTSVVVCL